MLFIVPLSFFSVNRAALFPMADPVLGGQVDFGHSFSQLGQIKQRIVAEAACCRAARKDFTFDDPSPV